MGAHQHLWQTDYCKFHPVNSDSAVFVITEKPRVIAGAAKDLPFYLSVFSTCALRLKTCAPRLFGCIPDLHTVLNVVGPPGHPSPMRSQQQQVLLAARSGLTSLRDEEAAQFNRT